MVWISKKIHFWRHGAIQDIQNKNNIGYPFMCLYIYLILYWYIGIFFWLKIWCYDVLVEGKEEIL